MTARADKDAAVVAVVVTHDRPELLKLCLDALRSQSVGLTGIVVVDNASGEETARILKQEPGLTVLTLERNTGGSGGFCAGVVEALSTGPTWVWLLDDDVVLRPDALERLLCREVDVGGSSSSLGALCPAVLEEGRLALMHRRYFNARALREPVVRALDYARPAVEIDTASFVGLLVRADALRGVGPPDARFFLAYDDTEFSLRLRRAGYRIVLVPSSRADHLRQPEARLRVGPYSRRHYYNLRNRLIVYRKYGHASAWRWLAPLAEGALLLIVAGRGKPMAFSWWWKAMRDSRKEPYVLSQEAGQVRDSIGEIYGFPPFYKSRVGRCGNKARYRG